MSTTENLSRIVQMRDTQANIAASAGATEEATIAYATDTGQLGIYTGGAWVWLGGGPASSPLLRTPNPNTFVSAAAADQPPDFVYLGNGDIIGVGGQ